MRALNVKLLRDLWSMKGQMAAVSLVMACGLMVMIMARGLVMSLETARDEYYASHRLGHVFCDLKRAPNAIGTRLREIDGVASLETRIRGALTLDLPGLREPADGLVLSLPDGRETEVNRLHLRQGRLPEPYSPDEVVVSEPFAKAHGFVPGHTLEATIYGARTTLRIVGVGMSPEYVYETRPGETVPDNRRYGTFWMSEGSLADAFILKGAFNSVILTLAPGAETGPVKKDLDRILAPYGALVAFDRSEHVSTKLIDDRIAMLKGFAIAFPVIFLSIAAFMTSAALTRLVRLQREQIAQLKAFGYSSADVGLHYFQFALAAVVAATLLGSVVGLWMGQNLVEIYRRFFQFPNLAFRPDWWALGLALAASAGASFIGVLGAVRQAVKLPPAEAMRPEPPARFEPSVLERMGLLRLLSPTQRMALRNLERRPWQAFFTALGLAMATAIPIVPGAMGDGIDYLMDFQWRLAQRQDATVSLIEPASPSALHALAAMPGVLLAEPFRVVQGRIVNGLRQRRVGLTGRLPDARLNLLLDDKGRAVDLPLAGLLLSQKLAEVLELAPGDPVRIEVQEGRRPVLETFVAGTITDFAGVGAYMDFYALGRLMGEERVISGAHLTLDNTYRGEFLDATADTPAIASAVFTSSARESFQLAMGDMMGVVQAVYFGFAVIVSCGVVYNGARIALSERTRDLATLRVLGFSEIETTMILLSELIFLTLVALLPGLVIGSEMARVLVLTANTESVRMPLVLTGRAYATAVLIVLSSSMASFLVVGRRIRKLQLLAVLKAPE
ncbi:putative ABC transport system permease protein [Desulfomicrobium apsheronum]|uniref:Putative ABC transport system permease protein n=1 Tax=Desulfomicrobium apsheronum TaxID=52560 RepID=A0A1I4A608_9BACT|nr:FtsX-like permease family protein [Desulfomicrobium apsheronum]SFK51640.1 putative ABC transport system permease protein [Desulfomicrobium apsheronum]